MYQSRVIVLPAWWWMFLVGIQAYGEGVGAIRGPAV